MWQFVDRVGLHQFVRDPLEHRPVLPNDDVEEGMDEDNAPVEEGMDEDDPVSMSSSTTYSDDEEYLEYEPCVSDSPVPTPMEVGGRGR